MRNLFVSLILTTPLVACGGGGGGGGGSTQQPNDRQLDATLTALPGGGSITGTTMVDWTVGAGQFTAGISIANDIPGMTRPWHVHFGTCATGGDIAGPGGSYTALVIGADGTAQSSATVAFELSSTTPYHVNVHESQAAITTLIACGNLVGTAGGGGGGGGDDDDGGGY